MISFIVPCFNEQDNVVPFYQAFQEVFDRHGQKDKEWRLVMVDDGSSDETYQMLKYLSTIDSRVTVLSFSRNFGKEAALFAGLSECRDSEFIGIIDADLQQSPETAYEMLTILKNNNEYDCVAAFQEDRHEGLILNMAKRSFYRVFARASRSSDVIQGASDFRVFRRNVSQAILSMPEYHRFSKGIFSWVGFKTYAYPYTPSERYSGASKWSFFALLRYALEGILSFSTRPLHYVTVVGMVTSTLALIYAIILVVKTLIVGVDVPGYASITALILLFSGLQLLSLGIIGEYIARLYEQDKRRPVYIVKERINGVGEEIGR